MIPILDYANLYLYAFLLVSHFLSSLLKAPWEQECVQGCSLPPHSPGELSHCRANQQSFQNDRPGSNPS